VLATGPVRVFAQPAEVTIEEIVVTATRRAENIQDIPINIASFSGDELANREITDLAELGRNVPGLYVVDQGKRNSNYIVVRGLNLDSIRGPEALGNDGGGTVATYVGEIPLYVDLDLNDMERVEVLLGPQGTLYGAGTLGGALRYIPKRPDFASPALSFNATSFDLAESDSFGWRTGIVGNIPLGDNLALRASVTRYDDPGFIDTPFLVRAAGVSDPEPDFGNPADVAANLYGEKDANWEETLAGRIALRWAPTDNVDAVVSYFYQNVEVGGRSANHAVSFGTDRFASATRFPEPIERTNDLVSLEITADLGFAELISATGRSTYDELGQRDQTDLLITLEYGYEAFPSFSAFTRDDELDETLSQELRLVSKGDGKLSWIGGLFYMGQKTWQNSREFTPHYDEYLGGILRPDSLEYFSVLNTDLAERAVFGEVGFEITDRWQITLGARVYDYSYDTESGVAFPLADTSAGDLPPDETGIALEPAGQQDDGVLTKLNTSYHFTDDMMGYVTISEGYRIGASNGIALCTPGSTGQTVCATPEEFQYFPDSTINYEVGLHSQWLDRRLTFNGAVYFIDWKDPQVLTSTVAGAQPISKNGEGAESSGIELSFDARITDRLGIGFSYAHTTAELSEVTPRLLRVFTPPGFGPSDPPVYLDGQPGDRLPGSPKDQGTVHVDYSIPIGGSWGLDLSYGLQAIGDIVTKTGGQVAAETLGGFTVHSASAVFDHGSWRLGLYAQNLTNKYALTGVRTQREFVQTVTDENDDAVTVRSYAHNVLRPREIGLKFSYDFGL
jgi:outer membrane receptor protein involved in Fe transport